MPFNRLSADLVRADGGHLASNKSGTEPSVKTDFVGHIVDVLRLNSVHAAFVHNLQVASIASHTSRHDVQPIGGQNRSHAIVVVSVHHGDDVRAIVLADQAIAVVLFDLSRRIQRLSGAHRHTSQRSQLLHSRIVAKDGDLAQTTEMIQNAVQSRLHDTSTSAIERSLEVIDRIMKNVLDHQQLLVGDLFVGLTDQVGHVHTTAAQVHDVDRRTSGDLIGVHGHLLLRHIAPLGGGTLGLNVSTDALGLQSERGLVAVADVLLISNQIQEIQLMLLQLIDGESDGLSNLVTVSRRHILRQFFDDLSSLFSVGLVDAVVPHLFSQNLNQLAIASHIDIRHILSPPINQSCPWPECRTRYQPQECRSPDR